MSLMGKFGFRMLNGCRRYLAKNPPKPSKPGKSSKAKSGKPKIYLTRQISPEATKYLVQNCEVEQYSGPGAVPYEELLKKVVGKQGLYCLLTDNVNKEVIDAGKDLKVVCTMSDGFEHMDVKAMRARNIKVGNTPGHIVESVKESVSELTVTLLLALARRIFEQAHEARTGGWKTWSPFWMCGKGLHGTVVGIVGAGQIGASVMRQINGFKPKTFLYFNREVRADLEKEMPAKKVAFDELLEKSDFIVVCINLYEGTRKMFNKQAFSKMKSSAFLINTGRGGVIDQDALIEALKNKRIAGAGLDVTVPEPLPLDSPLFTMKNVVILPHVGSATYRTRNDMAMLAAKNIVHGLQGKPMPAELAAVH